MYDNVTQEEILNNVEEINNYVDTINEKMTRLITVQEEILSGDMAILESQQKTEIATYTIAIVVVMYVLFYYIVRCLK